MQQVILKPLLHREHKSIGIYYDNYPTINNILKKLPQIKWSQTNKCWYLPLNPESYNQLYKALSEKTVLDSTALKSYLEKRKQVAATIPASATKILSKPAASSPVWKLSKENLTALERFIEELKLKSYSASTIRTYRNEFLESEQTGLAYPTRTIQRIFQLAKAKSGISKNVGIHSVISFPHICWKKELTLNISVIYWAILILELLPDTCM